MSRVKITSDGSPGGTTVAVDGEVLDNVASVCWQVRGREVPRVSLDLIDVDLDVEADEPTVTTRTLHRPTRAPGVPQ